MVIGYCVIFPVVISMINKAFEIEENRPKTIKIECNHQVIQNSNVPFLFHGKVFNIENFTAKDYESQIDYPSLKCACVFLKNDDGKVILMYHDYITDTLMIKSMIGQEFVGWFINSGMPEFEGFKHNELKTKSYSANFFITKLHNNE